MNVSLLLQSIKASASKFDGTVKYDDSTLTITSPMLDEPQVYEVENDSDLALIDYIVSCDNYI